MSFSVEPEELTAAAGGLGRLVGELDAICGQIQGVDAGAAGHPALTSAISEFTSTWAREFEALHQALGDLQQRLSKAEQVYGEADAKVTRAFHA